MRISLFLRFTLASAMLLTMACDDDVTIVDDSSVTETDTTVADTVDNDTVADTVDNDTVADTTEEDTRPSNADVTAFTLHDLVVPETGTPGEVVTVSYDLQVWCADDGGDCRQQVVVGYDGAEPTCTFNGSGGTYPGATLSKTEMIPLPSATGSATLRFGLFETGALSCADSIAAFKASPFGYTGYTSTDVEGGTFAVVSTVPANDARGVKFADRALRVTFNEAVDADTLASAVTITSVGATGANFEDDGATLVISLTDLRPFKTVYTVTIAAGAKSASGNTMAADHSFSFTSELLTESFYYTLHSQSLGEGQLLDTRGTTLTLDDKVNLRDKQRWQFVRTSGSYWLRQKGTAGMSVEGAADATPAFLAETTGASGQHWTIIDDGTGWWKLQNTNHGSGKSLQVIGGDTYMRPTEFAASQAWGLTRIEEIQ